MTLAPEIPADIKGVTEARLFTPPLRELTRQTTRGYEVAEFAELIGEPLLPWQRWLVNHALEIKPDGTFRFRIVLVLVARQNGKSSVKRTVSLWRLYVDGARTVLGIAQDVALAREQMNHCVGTIMRTQDLREDWGRQSKVNGNEYFRLTDSSLPTDAPDEAHPRYVIRAANRKAGRGLSIDELNVDELREQKNWDAWSAVSKTVTARRHGQIWAMSNAGDMSSVVLNQLRGNALAGLDPSIGIFEWSGEEGCELGSWPDIARANPSLGYTISPEAIATSLGSDPPAVFRTEVLCQQVDALEDVVDKVAWKHTKDARGNLSSVDRGRLAVCFDAADNGAHATLAGAALMPDGRVRTAIIKAWRTTAEARTELGPLLDQLEAGLILWFPSGPAGELRPIFEGRDNVEALAGAKQSAACSGLVGIVKARRIIHPGDPLQTAHVLGVRKIVTGDVFRFVRAAGGAATGSTPGLAPSDAAYATAGAVYGAQVMPEPKRSGIRSMSA